MKLEIKRRLLDLGRSQRDLLHELAQSGVKTEPAQLSNAISGNINYPKAKHIIELSNQILSDWEQESK